LFAFHLSSPNGLTFGAYFFLVDGPDVHGLRYPLQRSGVVPAEVAPVLLLSKAAAVKGARVVAEPLAVVLGAGEQDVVHGHHGHVLLRGRVAAVGKG
jgi:hypothetical protein